MAIPIHLGAAMTHRVLVLDAADRFEPMATARQIRRACAGCTPRFVRRCLRLYSSLRGARHLWRKEQRWLFSINVRASGLEAGAKFNIC